LIPRIFRQAILVQGSKKPKKQPHLIITRSATVHSADAAQVPR